MQITQDSSQRHDARTGHMTTREAAALLGVSTATIRRYGARLGVRRFGRWHIDPAKVAAELEGHAA
jgi:DNA-binding MurR/RpiR family transcriptional regulator